MLGRGLVGALLALAIAVACSSTTKTDVDPVCAPGEAKDCRGAEACLGTQICNDQGTGFGACQCLSGTGGTSATGGTGGGGSGGSTGGSGGTTGGTGGTGGSVGGSGGSDDDAGDAFQCTQSAAMAQQCLNSTQNVNCPEGRPCVCDNCACLAIACFANVGCSAIVACAFANCNANDIACVQQACSTLISQYPAGTTAALALNNCMNGAGCACGAADASAN
jgi:hypothetical protein